MLKILIFILGVILCSFSLSTMILYLNLLNFGYSFGEYFLYIIKQTETYLMIVGGLLIYFSFIRKNKY